MSQQSAHPIKDEHEAQDFTLECQPSKIVRWIVSRISSDPIWLQAKTFFGPIDHLTHGFNCGGSVRADGLDNNDDTVTCIDQLFGGIQKTAGPLRAAVYWMVESAWGCCHPWIAPFMQSFLTDIDRWAERSCVRPVGAIYITAGLDEVRVSRPWSD